MPDVSIVLPCFNQGHYLAEAVDSILGQLYGDWEAIIVDDGSTDITGQIAEGYRDPRIKYVYQDNQGLASARNTALKMAEGNFVAFLDADDKWAAGFLSQCLDRLEARPELGGVFTHHFFMDEDGEVLPRIEERRVDGTDIRDLLLEGGFFPPCTVVLRMPVLCQVGLFDTELAGRGAEDWDLWLRVSEKHSIGSVAIPLAYYRIHAESMSANIEQMFMCQEAVLVKIFGKPDQPISSWPVEKRKAFGFLYRSTGIRYLMQGDEMIGRDFLTQAVIIYPHLLERLDTYYEIACGDQPFSYRGDAHRLDIEANAGKMFDWLGQLFGNHEDPRVVYRQSALARANLALAILSDQAGQWSAARKYMFKSIKLEPSQLSNLAFVRRTMKLIAGKRLMNKVRGKQK